jgi:hypothetical protein
MVAHSFARDPATGVNAITKFNVTRHCDCIQPHCSTASDDPIAAYRRRLEAAILRFAGGDATRPIANKRRTNVQASWLI